MNASGGSARAYDLVTFGETMIRLTAAGGRRLEEAEALEVAVGGTESNVAVALARLGRHVAWLSALPDNPLGRRIGHELRGHGVDLAGVRWIRDARVGVYFLDPGSPPRPTRVLYDRAGSAVAGLTRVDIDLDLVRRARVLHLTGITPALSQGCSEIWRGLAQAARDAGVPIILDVNYRSQLWTPAAAREGLAPVTRLANVLICGADDAAVIWGQHGSGEVVARALLERSSAELVVVTLGAGGACALSRGGTFIQQSAVPVTIVDAVGAGDAFAAGFIDRWLDKPEDVGTALRAGVSLAALAMTMPGDLAIVTRAELDETSAQLGTPGRDIIR
jgi:2-dehydro-3-deoxygluconokinase